LLDYADPRGYQYALIDLAHLIPDPENPRLPPQESVLDTLLALVRQPPGAVYALAKDIVTLGGNNPAELLNVSELPAGDYLVREGIVGWRRAGFSTTSNSSASKSLATNTARGVNWPRLTVPAHCHTNYFA
jgi:hypothetical protein